MEESPQELTALVRPFLTDAFRHELEDLPVGADHQREEQRTEPQRRVSEMATSKQRTAARRDIRKAARAAKRKRTVARLPKRTRTALGREGAKAAKRKRRAGR
jgi:hypothetical protein